MIENENMLLIEKIRAEIEELLTSLENNGRLNVAQESLVRAALAINAADQLDTLNNLVTGAFGDPTRMFDHAGMFTKEGRDIINPLNNEAGDLYNKTIPELISVLKQRCGNNVQLWMEVYADIKSNERLELEFNNR